jgi:hypothetical protein
MSTYYLAAATGYTSTPQPVEYMIPSLTLESLDGGTQIPLDASEGWIRMPGSTGLEMPPYSVVSDTVPGVPGAVLRDTRVEARPVFIPIYCGGTDQITFREMLDKIQRIVAPYGAQTFKIVGRSYRGTRELVVTYVSGLEGADDALAAGLTWCKIGLNAVAHDPYSYERVERSLEFRSAGATSPFMGIAGNSDTPFPVMLSSGSVIGAGMTITIASEVPVYPVLDLVGPMDSFAGTLSPTVVNPDGTITVLTENVWSVDIPAGVPTGQTLRLVTDPRARSVRLDGALAAGRVARGSATRPFFPGDNVLNVVAPGGTDDTRIRLTWREQHRSLW